MSCCEECGKATAKLTFLEDPKSNAPGVLVCDECLHGDESAGDWTLGSPCERGQR